MAISLKAVRSPLPPSLQVRPVIEAVRPLVDGGQRPAKAAVGDTVTVEADVIADGHDVLTCDLRFRHDDDLMWSSVAMEPLVNDRWRAGFEVRSMGQHRFLIEARVDPFMTWRRDLRARADAGQDIAVELHVGAELVDAGAHRAEAADRRVLSLVASDLWSAADGLAGEVSDEITALVGRLHPGRARLLRSAGAPHAAVRRPRAGRRGRRSSRWRSTGRRPASARGTSCSRARPRPTRSATGPSPTSGRSCPTWPDMGFDVLYLPPDPPDRPHRPQGPRRRHERRPGRPGQSVGHRRRRGRAHGGPPRARAPSTTSATW